MSEPIHLGGLKVGEKVRRTLRLFVGPRHFYRRVGGFSVDQGLIESLRDEIDTIEFYDKSAKKAFRISLADFLTHAIALPNMGWGVKLCAPGKYYETEGRKPYASDQPGLWAGA